MWGKRVLNVTLGDLLWIKEPLVCASNQMKAAYGVITSICSSLCMQIDVLKADMESAEWKILENLILDDVLPEIGQLLLEVHLHWPGFEVGGDDATVVRYWFSLLKELECSHFQLFYSQSDSRRPRLFLRQDMFNSSSVYILGWVNSRWRPR